MSATLQGTTGDGNQVAYERTAVDANAREQSFQVPDLIVDVAATTTYYLAFTATSTATTNWYGTSYAVRIA